MPINLITTLILLRINLRSFKVFLLSLKITKKNMLTEHPFLLCTCHDWDYNFYWHRKLVRPIRLFLFERCIFPFQLLPSIIIDL